MVGKEGTTGHGTPHQSALDYDSLVAHNEALEQRVKKLQHRLVTAARKQSTYVLELRTYRQSNQDFAARVYCAEQRVQDLEAEIYRKQTEHEAFERVTAEYARDLTDALQKRREENVALEQRVKDLEDENGNMDSMYQDRMLILEGKLHEHYNHLRIENEQLKRDVDGTCQQLNTLRAENERLRERIKYLEENW
jgi:chromosome segregation ATPase